MSVDPKMLSRSALVLAARRAVDTETPASALTPVPGVRRRGLDALSAYQSLFADRMARPQRQMRHNRDANSQNEASRCVNAAAHFADEG